MKEWHKKQMKARRTLAEMDVRCKKRALWQTRAWHTRNDEERPPDLNFESAEKCAAAFALKREEKGHECAARESESAVRNIAKVREKRKDKIARGKAGRIQVVAFQVLGAL